MKSVFDLAPIDFWIETILNFAKEHPKEDFKIYTMFKIIYDELPIAGKTPDRYENFVLRLADILKV